MVLGGARIISGMLTSEIREKYLRFFESKGHLRLPSFSLIPEDDPSLLFTVAGMAPLKPFFLGEKPVFPEYPGEHRRVVSAQKCLRIGDIENVGRTARHNTFFEMLGNFSFGDYFKLEAITWAWEFMTGEAWLGLSPRRLYVTVYDDDDEAYAIWRDQVGVPEEQISRWGEDENFWPASAVSQGPNGPCGPCSEIFYDRGPSFGGTDENGPNAGSGDRFVEVWNLVFTQFNRSGPIPGVGQLSLLPQKNIDTGLGLYRLAAVLQDVPDLYDTDTFKPLIDRVAERSGQAYRGPSSVSHRVIADHSRAVVAALADGVDFSNTGRGYVVRRLLRRAVRHGHLLGLRGPFMSELAGLVAETLGGAFPKMQANLSVVKNAILREEERFSQTLELGIRRLARLIKPMRPGEILPGDEAFRLYDTYGFPLELTLEICNEHRIRVDAEGFESALAEQQLRARAASNFGQGAIFTRTTEALKALFERQGTTVFTGYAALEADSVVQLILLDEQALDSVPPGSEAEVVLDRTPFYAEGGGQVGDQGRLEWPRGRAVVLGTYRSPQGLIVHRVRIEEGSLEPSQPVRAVVDECRRRATERNHTATHLLHAALRVVLGTHVRQAGSLVAPEHMRFDFSHDGSMSTEEIGKVERLVNRWIQADFPVGWTLKPIAEAKAEAATALFGEKYGEIVRVVSVEGDLPTGGDPAVVHSKELCGGCHLRRTGEIGLFTIVSEASVSSGVRRVEVLTGEAAVRHHRELLERSYALSRLLGAPLEGLVERVDRLIAELREKERETTSLKHALAQAQLGSKTSSEPHMAGGVRYLAVELNGLDASALRQAADELLERHKEVDLVAVGSGDALTIKIRDAEKRDLAAGLIMKQLARLSGGRGGGRAGLAQGGGFDVSKALILLEQVLGELGT